MSRRIDMTGQRFGILTVVGKADSPAQSGELRWLCRCDCGNTVVASGSHLRRGDYISCGCVRKKKAHTRLLKLPRNYAMKYGCYLCANKKKCVKLYAENAYLVCKYAHILDPYGCYHAYEKAVEKKYKNLFGKDNTNENFA